MLNILQTGDLHLGKILYEYSLLDDQKHMLDALVQELHSFTYDALIITGDIYDRSIPPPEAVSLFDNFLTRIHSELPQLAVCFISGNHDSEKRLAFGRNLFSSQNIHICTNPTDCTQPILLTHASRVQAALYQMPFLQAGSLTAKDGTILKNQQELATEAINRIIDAHTALQNSKSEYKNLSALLNCHVFTIGGDSCDSERLFIGTAELINHNLFAPFTYTAAGHLHKNQRVGERLSYAGSPLAYSFSEARAEKSFLRIEIDTRDATFNNTDTNTGLDADKTAVMPDIQITPIIIKPLRRLVPIECAFDEFATYSQYKNDFIEFTCTDLILIENAVARLRETFPFLLSVKQKAFFIGENSNNENSEKKRQLLEKKGDLRDILSTFLLDTGVMSDSNNDWESSADLFEKTAQEVDKDERYATA